MMRTILLVLTYISCSATGDLMVSHGMKQRPGVEGVLLPWIIGAMAVLAVGHLIFLRLLKDVPLSVVVPAGASSFMVIAVLSHLVLHEEIPPLRWVGTTLVSCGVALVMISDWQRRRAGLGITRKPEVELPPIPCELRPGPEPATAARVGSGRFGGD